MCCRLAPLTAHPSSPHETPAWDFCRRITPDAGKSPGGLLHALGNVIPKGCPCKLLLAPPSKPTEPLTKVVGRIGVAVSWLRSVLSLSGVESTAVHQA
jgi:hypothetical protein